MLFFTADEHYGHKNIIEYCTRPFDSVHIMNKELIRCHNEVVQNGDTVIHAGDFTLKNTHMAKEYIKQLNGNHIFLRGSHDRWLPKDAPFIIEKTVDGQHIVVCHYAMRVWSRSHYNSWQLYGHSHGRLNPEGKQWDIGVDNNQFYPISFDQIKAIMTKRPNNLNYIKMADRRK